MRGEFRSGRPYDRVSLSTGYDYIDVPDSASVFPNEGVRRYLLTKMAIYLWGKNFEEELMILTGSGSNGKSKTIELLQHALGEYAVHLPAALVTQKLNVSNVASWRCMPNRYPASRADALKTATG